MNACINVESSMKSISNSSNVQHFFFRFSLIENDSIDNRIHKSIIKYKHSLYGTYDQN